MIAGEGEGRAFSGWAELYPRCYRSGRSRIFTSLLECAIVVRLVDAVAIQVARTQKGAKGGRREWGCGDDLRW